MSFQQSSGLHGLVDANEKGRALPAVLTRPWSDDESVELNDIEVRTPAGDRLIDPPRCSWTRGREARSPGAPGHTTLLRSLAELWPYASGDPAPAGRRERDDVLSQLPHVPLGTLRRGVLPNSAAAILDAPAGHADQGGAGPTV